MFAGVHLQWTEKICNQIANVRIRPLYKYWTICQGRNPTRMACSTCQSWPRSIGSGCGDAIDAPVDGRMWSESQTTAFCCPRLVDDGNRTRWQIRGWPSGSIRQDARHAPMHCRIHDGSTICRCVPSRRPLWRPSRTRPEWRSSLAGYRQEGVIVALSLRGRGDARWLASSAA